MKRSMKFKLDIMEAFAAALDRQIKHAEAELSTLTPDDLKNEETRNEFMGLMLAVEEAKRMFEGYSEAKKVAAALPEDGKPQEKASIGFTAQLKKAA